MSGDSQQQAPGAGRLGAWAVLGGLMLVAIAVMLYAQRGVTFYVDEWQLLVERRDWDPDAFLSPLYEHLFLLPILIFKLLMAATGIGPHWAYSLPLIALHLLSVLLVYLLARRRLGDWFALAPAVVVLFLGYAWEDLVLPIQVSLLGSVAAGLAMLLALDPPPTRLKDGAACILLAVSIASSSLGLSFAVAAAVEVLLRPGARRRLWVVAAPLVLYAAWYLAYAPGHLQQGGDLRGNLRLLPAYVADAAAGAFGAVTGLGLTWGRIFAVFGTVVVARHLLRSAGLPARLIALLCAALSFWALTGLGRAHLHEPDSSRYLYPGALFVVLAAAEVLSSARLGRREGALLAAGLVFAVAGNANALYDATFTMQARSRTVLAQFGALEILGRDTVPPDFVPARQFAPAVDATGYFDMVDELGSPVDLRRDVLALGEKEREEVDAVLASALAAQARRHGPATTALPCVPLPASAAGEGTVVVTARSRGAVVRTRGDGPVQVAVRRLGRQFQEVALVPADSTFALPLPAGGLAEPWHLRVTGGSDSEICTVAPAG